MFCHNCGAKFPVAARFCNVCGAPVDHVRTITAHHDEQTLVRPTPQQPATQHEQSERMIFAVRPTLLFIQLGYALAFFGAAVLGGILLYLGSFFELPLLMWLAVPLALLLFLIPAYYHFQRNLVRYTLTNAKLEIDSGFLSRQTQFIALGKIQDVTVSASFWQRLFGYGDLVIDNAATERRAPLVLKGINNPRYHADLLLREMRKLEN